MFEIIFFILRAGVEKKTSEEIINLINNTLKSFVFIQFQNYPIQKFLDTPKNLPQRFHELISNDEELITVKENNLVTLEQFQKKIFQQGKGVEKLLCREMNSHFESRRIVEGRLSPLSDWERKIIVFSLTKLRLIQESENKSQLRLNQADDAIALKKSLLEVIRDVYNMIQIDYADQFIGKLNKVQSAKLLRYNLINGISNAKDTIGEPKSFFPEHNVSVANITNIKLEVDRLEQEKNELKQNHPSLLLQDKIIEIEKASEKLKDELSFNKVVDDIKPSEQDFKDELTHFEKGIYGGFVFLNIPRIDEVTEMQDSISSKIYEGLKLLNLDPALVNRSTLMVKNPEVSFIEDWELVYKTLRIEDEFKGDFHTKNILLYNKMCSNINKSMLSILNGNGIVLPFEDCQPFQKIIIETCRDNQITEREKEFLLEKAKYYNIDISIVNNFLENELKGYSSFVELVNEIVADGKVTEVERAYLEEKAAVYNLKNNQLNELIEEGLFRVKVTNSSVETSLKDLWLRLFFIKSFDISDNLLRRIKVDILKFLSKKDVSLPSNEMIIDFLDKTDEAISNAIKIKYKIPTVDFKFDFKKFSSVIPSIISLDD